MNDDLVVVHLIILLSAIFAANHTLQLKAFLMVALAVNCQKPLSLEVLPAFHAFEAIEMPILVQSGV